MDIERRLLFAERQRALVFAHPQGYVVTREAAMSAFAKKLAAGNRPWKLTTQLSAGDRVILFCVARHCSRRGRHHRPCHAVHGDPRIHRAQS
jgi:hypothetical protein